MYNIRTYVCKGIKFSWKSSIMYLDSIQPVKLSQVLVIQLGGLEQE